MSFKLTLLMFKTGKHLYMLGVYDAVYVKATC